MLFSKHTVALPVPESKDLLPTTAAGVDRMISIKEVIADQRGLHTQELRRTKALGVTVDMFVIFFERRRALILKRRAIDLLQDPERQPGRTYHQFLAKNAIHTRTLQERCIYHCLKEHSPVLIPSDSAQPNH